MPRFLPRLSGNRAAGQRRGRFYLLSGVTLAVAAVLYGAVAVCLSPGAVWITDNGNKYIQMRWMAEHGSAPLAADPMEFFPTGGFHFQAVEQGFRSFYLDYLPGLSVPFYQLAGERGVLLLPIFGTFLLLLLYQLWRKSPSQTLLLATTTPLAFYSVLFWDMTPGAALVFAGLLAALSRRHFTSGLLLALGLSMREESYFAVAALGLALLLSGQWRGTLRLGLGFLAGAVPFWIRQYLVYGHILGFHGATYYLNNREGWSLAAELRGALWNYYHNWLRFDLGGSATISTALAAISLLALGCGFMVSGSGRNRRLKLTVLGIAIILWCLSLPCYFRRNDLSFAAATSVGVVASLPVLWGYFLNWRFFLIHRNHTLRLAGLTVLIYLVAVPPLLTRDDIGLVWGARHFLGILPAAFYLSWLGFRRLAATPAGRLAVRSALALGIIIQCAGLYALIIVSDEAAAAERQLRSYDSPIVITDLFFLPEMTPRLFFEKHWLYVDSDKQADRLAAYLDRTAPGRFILAVSLDPRFRRIGNPALTKTLRNYRPASEPFRLDFRPGSGFMKLIFMEFRLK